MLGRIMSKQRTVLLFASLKSTLSSDTGLQFVKEIKQFFFERGGGGAIKEIIPCHGEHTCRK